MRPRSRFLLVGVPALLLPLLSWAQGPASTPVPVPATDSNGYPDIESLREPGSSAKLFPSPSASPAAGAAGTGANPATGRNNNALLRSGQHRRATRANDLLGDQADADPLELRVAYRRAKTVALARDPGLAELLRTAANADTDVRKRSALREYYTRLFAGVRKVDPSPEMRKHVELLGEVAQQRYDPQRRTVGGEEEIVRGGRRGRGR